MPWGAPIGSARGLNNVYGLRTLRAHFPGHAAGGRCRPRRALACRGGDGAGLRRRAAQHGRRRGGRSGRDGARLRAGRRGRPRRPSAPGRMEPRDMAAPSTPVLGKAVLGAMSMLDPFYPVVPDSSWVARLVPAGARLIQLRIKDQPDGRDRAARCARPRRSAPPTARSSSSTTTGRSAIDEGCDYVHLGQEDLVDADVKALRRAGMPHRRQHARSCRARARASPSIPTMWRSARSIRPLLKQMPWAPQGTARLAEWKRLIGDRPLVAIGGLTLERALLCLAVGRRHRGRRRRHRQQRRSRSPRPRHGSRRREASPWEPGHERPLRAPDGASRGRRCRPGAARCRVRRWWSAPAGWAARCCSTWRAPASAGSPSSITTGSRKPTFIASRSTRMADIGKLKAEAARPRC